MVNINETMKFRLEIDKKEQVKEILDLVFDALKEKGYNPVSQIVGYLVSGDPTYITSHQNARSVIGRLERDEILEVVIKTYLENNGEKATEEN